MSFFTFELLLVSVRPIMLAVGFFVLFHRTGHSKVTCVLVALISTGSGYLHLLTAYGVTLGVDFSVILIVSSVVSFFFALRNTISSFQTLAEIRAA